jgi:dTDP-4-dehydrorhamnose 3,5-epimerase
MKVTPLGIPEVLLIEPKVFGDARGYFLETFQAERYAEAGIPGPFVQDNMSRSSHGILRGLHLQNPRLQGKLVQVVEGEVFDVAVDVRVGSPSFGQWVSAVLSAHDHRQLYIPPGFAHGFCVLSEHALFAYKCTDLYFPQHEVGLPWNDPDLAIHWPVEKPLVSEKDGRFKPLAKIDPTTLPQYKG